MTVTICDQATRHIHKLIRHAAMTRMLDLRYVFEMINDGFNDCSATQQDAIAPGHQLVLHVLAQLGNPLKIKYLVDPTYSSPQCDKLLCECVVQFNHLLPPPFKTILGLGQIDALVRLTRTQAT